jgi:methionyl-tRNA formyltransferase
MRKVIYIGNRSNALKGLIRYSNKFDLIQIFVLKNSLLHQEIENFGLKYTLFEANNQSKDNFVKFLKKSDYDILISNGCPFILPVSDLNKINTKGLFINTHPSFLPHLRGKTPLNGVFMLDYDFIGATTHFMDDGIDHGNIIYQSKIDLTPDLDQGLVYKISFELERIVFEKAIETLINHNFNFEGQKQEKNGSYFNRKEELFKVDFKNDNCEVICRKINSLGMTTMLNVIKTNNESTILAHHAEKIINPFLLSFYNSKSPGDILYSYSDKMLIRTIDGILKIAFVNAE